MAHANVSNGVLTIIASFSNGLDVLRKLRRSNKNAPKRTKASKRNDEDALRLSRSLRHGPEDIGREYQAGSMHCDSERYAMGDATAQSSLAEILLRLNTGLVSIIASFLGRGSKTGLDLDYKSLTDLSDHSRVQTIGVLHQLYQRVLAKSGPQILPQARGERMKPKKSSHHASPKHTKIRHPTLARVLIENSSVPSQIAIVRPSESNKKQRSQVSCEPPRPHLRLSPAASTPNFSPPPPPYFPSDPLPIHQQLPQKPPRHRSSSTSLLKSRTQLKHKPSVPLPSLPQNNMAPPSNHLASTTSQINLRPQRLRPETLYSLASARTGSTKLGEIPMHKWTEPWDFEAAEEGNRKALASGWPVHRGDGADGADDKKTKIGCWKRWFGRRAKAI